MPNTKVRVAIENASEKETKVLSLLNNYGILNVEMGKIQSVNSKIISTYLQNSIDTTAVNLVQELYPHLLQKVEEDA